MGRHTISAVEPLYVVRATTAIRSVLMMLCPAPQRSQRRKAIDHVPVLMSSDLSAILEGRIRPQIGHWAAYHRVANASASIMALWPSQTPAPTILSTVRRWPSETDSRRNVVERLVGWIKEYRRVATRYEKLAVNYLAMLKLAMMRRYFRVLADTA